MVGRVRRRFPSQEELELWAKVTRHDEPLVRRRRPAPLDSAIEGAPAAIPPKPAESRAKGQDAPSPPVATPGRIARNRSRPVEPPPPQPFDPRAAQRIARGRREIDARLDLHGMRQSDAHAALRGFLARCQAEGYRHVLIITGKGINLEADERRDFWTSEQRGVLRRLVPHWLSEPSMRTHVVSFTESAIKHGGSGALYVTIRKGPRSRS